MPDDASAAPVKTSEQKVDFDKLILTLQAASSANTNAASPKQKTAVTETPDFQPEQKVKIHISTVLNSPSVLDRIEYVSTYIYVFPWQNSPNGNVVLERELWRNFFEVNQGRDPLVRDHMKFSDMRRALEDLQVRVCDIGTTVQYSPIDLGSLAQTTVDTTDLGLTGTITGASPAVPTINPTLKYNGVLNTVANISLKQQLDQRSTYIDPQRDFIRITQRGMQSVNLAGRIKEILTLTVPAAEQPLYVLTAKSKVVPAATLVTTTNTTANPHPAGNGGRPMGTKSGSQTTTEYEETTLAQPVYSRVEAFTFSVVVGREATHLLHSARDRYGLDDGRSANFIADVTAPQLIPLWQWERTLDDIRTWDIFGTSDSPSKSIFARTYPGEQPFPLVLKDFTPQQRHDLLAAIYQGWQANSNVVTMIGRLTVGLPNNENNPTDLTPLKP
jgi:hypothetical protein